MKGGVDKVMVVAYNQILPWSSKIRSR